MKAEPLPTSDLIDRYCALRSSSGTFMRDFLFELSVGFGAGAELCRQIARQAEKDISVLESAMLMAWRRIRLRCTLRPMELVYCRARLMKTPGGA